MAAFLTFFSSLREKNLIESCENPKSPQFNLGSDAVSDPFGLCLICENFGLSLSPFLFVSGIQAMDVEARCKVERSVLFFVLNLFNTYMRVVCVFTG